MSDVHAAFFLLLFILIIAALVAWIRGSGRRLWIRITVYCLAMAFAAIVGDVFLKERARRLAFAQTTCKLRLSNLRTAMYDYQDEHDSFPPRMINDETGRPMHSWRVLLLPYLPHHDYDSNPSETFNLYDFDQPWNSETNLQLESRMPTDYRDFCHTRSRSTPNGDVNSEWMTSTVAVDDSIAVLENGEVRLTVGNGGLSTHLTLACTRTHFVHWMAPEDITAVELTGEIADREGNHSGGTNILCDDGQIRFWTHD